MFSLISLYFASRRDVVLAERHIAAIAAKPAAAAVPAPIEAEPIRLAA
ncbi:hypothetical protein [Novosphingobium soli]|uniref:Uncharacterized protein n=1 Tax=Novosphingobium soli TaxID=574956 RepID=A0ABV6CRL6_9SPHN